MLGGCASGAPNRHVRTINADDQHIVRASASEIKVFPRGHDSTSVDQPALTTSVDQQAKLVRMDERPDAL